MAFSGTAKGNDDAFVEYPILNQTYFFRGLANLAKIWFNQKSVPMSAPEARRC
ncbi:hypothetical protein [Microcoleus sp. bin38.metabat.b11b12b14.051]|uniref:hypothetical protein n=1 Tax=Microcoleus sp. bin38.metabat.b11b12b14.051 TaxID=2742709 RepID=UPI0025E229A0|nr:hypothetical protein [Microcoleus sp. bin38.metabat.b11b12b14.051]